MERRRSADLAGKVIDVHSHAGVSLKAYACGEYPYAATVEGLYHRQLAHGVDVNVVFPFTADLYFDWDELRGGTMVPAMRPASPAPYAAENELLMREVYEFCPELSARFLPFVSLDPVRAPEAQIKHLQDLAERYPIYGVKVNPVLCQAPVTGLLNEGRALLDLCRAHDWPLLLHTTVDPQETYSRADLAFEVIQRCPDLRFCLAHAIGFDEPCLRRADELPNVWVDTAALKIQVQMAREQSPLMAPPGRLFAANYSDHREVMRALAGAWPHTLLWGSDTPAYVYMCDRRQGDGVTHSFRLKAGYADEVAALEALPAAARRAVAGDNTRRFLFGAA